MRDRILHIYSKRGFDSIDPADLRGRFRWMGLYTQRKPGIDGGKTAVLDEEELDDRYFMLRVRSDGQLLSPATVRALGTIGVDFARDTADVTDRENIQYHWIRVEDVPEIWSRLDAAGLSSIEACGDSPRPFLGSPVAGVAKDEIIDGSAALAEIFERYIGDPAFSNLPRKFKTALTGHPSHDVSPETNDVSFVGTVHPELGPGFDLWVGGGLSTNPMLAQKLGVWIPPHEVADAWAGVASVFRDYGYRRLRSRARLKFLVADWGVEKFREVLEKEYLGRELVSTPSPPSPVGHRDHIGVHEQKDGTATSGSRRPSAGSPARCCRAGRAGGGVRCRGPADAVPEAGLIGVAPTESTRDRPSREIGLSARPSKWRRNTMACTGIEFCKLAIVDTKDRAATLSPSWSAFPRPRHPDHRQRERLPERLRPHAGRRLRSEGSAGSRRRPAGRRVPGAPRRSPALERQLRRKLRAHKVTSAGLDDYVSKVVTEFLAGRGDDELFAAWVVRADEALLAPRPTPVGGLV